MSLEALNALKQLNDTRQSGNEVQQGNLEKVQGEVQNQGTSEATRVDSLSLEVIKAQYESELHNAQITRLQQQQAREAAAVTLTGVIALGGAILGAADLLWNTGKDIYHAAGGGDGGQWGKDGPKDEAVKDIDSKTKLLGNGNGTNIVVGSSDPNIKNSDIQKQVEKSSNITSETVGHDSQGGAITEDKLSLTKDQAIKLGFLDKTGNKITQEGKDAGFTYGGKFGNKGGYVDLSSINDMNKLYIVDAGLAKNLLTSKTAEAEEKSGSTVYMAKTNSKGIVTEVGSADISSKKVQEALGNVPGLVKNGKIDIDTKQAEALGLVKDGKITLAGEIAGLGGKDSKFSGKGTIDSTLINNFEKFRAIAPEAADTLLNKEEHDVQKRESSGFLSAFKGAVGSDNNLFKDVNAKLEADGKSGQFWKKTGDIGKNAFNGVIQLAETVVPLLQAFLAARDKATNTAEELQMAMEKLAANEKKLKQLQALMINAGAGGMGKI